LQTDFKSRYSCLVDYRGVLLSTLLHAIVYDFTQFAECICRDCTKPFGRFYFKIPFLSKIYGFLVFLPLTQEGKWILCFLRFDTVLHMMGVPERDNAGIFRSNL
jgi:hypothetical protein